MRDLPEGDGLSLPKGWVETTLGEVGKAVTGKTPSKNNPEYWGDTLDFITPTDFKGDSKILARVDRRLSNKGKSAFKRLLIPSYSVIVTCIGSDMGKVGVNKNECVTNQQINSLIINQDKYDADFIHYLLKSSYKVLRLYADGGSTMPIINKSTFENLTFEIPPLSEQKAIADMLSSLDEKIELLREQNKTLETLAQTIFKEWFVHFNSPDPHGKPYRNNGGAMVASELGLIPQGWRVGAIGDLFELHRGFDLPKKDREDGAYPVYAAGGYHGQHKEYKMEPPGIITGRSGVIGKVYLSLTKYWPLNTTLYVRNFKACGPYYTYFFLNRLDLESINSGSAVPSLNRNNVHNIPTLIAGSNVLERFEILTKEIFAKIKFNDSQVETLSRTRDALLPKLMSGKVRVKA